MQFFFFFGGGTFYEKPKTSKPRTKMESQKNKKKGQCYRADAAAKTGKGRKAQKTDTLGRTSQPKVLKKSRREKQKTSKNEVIAGG
jgi:hypothetical protein